MDNCSLVSHSKEDDEGKRQVLDALKALRDGKQTSRVVCNLQGLDREIADVLNEVLAQHEACSAEMLRVVQEVDEGRDARINLDGTHGSWLDIMGSMDKIIRSHSEHCHQFHSVINAVLHGDLSRKITLDMKGGPLELKNVVNGMVDLLNSIVGGMTLITHCIVGSEGRFGDTMKTEEQHVEGRWLDMVQNANAMSIHIKKQFEDISTSLNGVSASVANFEELKTVIDEIILTQSSQVRITQHYYCAMTHEFRTPLNGVMGGTEMLMATPLNEEQYEFANIVKRSSRILMDLLNDFLDFDRVNGDTSIYESSFYLRRTCEAVLCDISLKRNNVTLNIDIDHQIADELIGDASIFQKIMRYFVEDALRDYYSEDVLITVQQLSCDGQNVILEINITDTGTGYSEDQVRDIMFGCVNHKGFYLPVAFRWVQLMKGKYKIQSTKHKGSTVTYTIPFKLDPTARGTFSAHHLEPGQLLVVCSHAMTQQVLARTIAGFKIQPVVTGSADEAREIMQQSSSQESNFVAALIDGDVHANEQTVEYILKHHHMPVLVMSSCERAPLPNTTRLTKPVGPMALLDAIRKSGNRNTSSRSAANINTSARVAHTRNPDARILFAARNAVNRKVYARILQRLGYNKLTIVETGTDAIMELEKGVFDVLFLDTIEDALETTRAIRSQQSPNMNIMIIGMTAADLMHHRDQYLASGMDQYITKPVTAETFSRLLSSFPSSPPLPSLPLLPPPQDQKDNKREEEGAKEEADGGG